MELRKQFEIESGLNGVGGIDIFRTKYIAWLEEKITASNSDYTKLAKWVHDCVSFGGTVEQVEDYLRKSFA